MGSLITAAFVATLFVGLQSVLCQKDRPCITELSSRNGLIFSFLPPINQIEAPSAYQVNLQTQCIVFMDLNWDDDVTIRLNGLNSYQPHPALPSVEVTTRSRHIGLAEISQFVILEKLTDIKVTGNTTRSFAIIFNKKSPTFAFTYKVKKVRELTCPDLKSEFDFVSCSDGSRVGSRCTFQCKNGSYPAPDLYNSRTSAESLKMFQASGSNQFFSTCSVSDSDTRNRPAWKPDALTLSFSTMFGAGWADVPFYWKCVDRTMIVNVCFPRESVPKPITVFFVGLSGPRLTTYITRQDCLYPIDYLLSIFNEERNGEFITTTTTTTTTTQLPLTRRRVMGGPEEFTAPVPPRREAFMVPTLDCTIYCQIDSTTKTFAASCGNFPTPQEQIDCLTCKHTPGTLCTQSIAVR